MGQISFDAEDTLAIGLTAVTVGRYAITSAYAACYYDWIISLDEEVAFIHPAPWNVVKVTYLFCRYYPLAIAPFHFWGFIGDHEQRVCETYYAALYYSTMPMMLSAQFIMMLRTYAFSGKKKWVLAILSITLLSLVGVIIWVRKKLSLPLLYLIVDRTGCFGISDQPTLTATGSASSKVPVGYHLGIISIIAAFFDFLNSVIVVRRCIQERGILGPLGQSFLKQGILFYAIMTIANVLTIGTYYSPVVLHDFKSIGPYFAYILPSALSSRLVLMLRRSASPTETELRFEYSHMVNDAVEMITASEETPKNLVPSISTDDQGLP